MEARSLRKNKFKSLILKQYQALPRIFFLMQACAFLSNFSRNKIICATTMFSVLLHSITFGQNTSASDSLKNVLFTTKQDTTRILTLAALAGKLDLSDPDSALMLSQQALKIAQKIDWPKGVATSFNCIATAHFRKGDYTVSMNYQKRAMAIWDSLKFQKGIAATYSGIGLIYWRQGDHPKALENYFNSIRIERARGDSAAVAKSIGNVGIIYAERK